MNIKNILRNNWSSNGYAMSASIYNNKLLEPDEEMLAKDLVETKPYFDKIATFIEDEYGDFKTEWKFYNASSGWILKMLTKKRNVLFVVPCHRYFRTVFTFGDKAADLLFGSDVSEDIKKDLIVAKKYAEGRTIQIEIREKSDLENVLKMIIIKLI